MSPSSPTKLETPRKKWKSHERRRLWRIDMLLLPLPSMPSIFSAAAAAFSYSLGMPLSEEVLNAIFLISLSVPFKPGVGREMMAQPLLMLSHDVQSGKTPSTGPTDELPLHSAFVALMTVQAILDRITSIAAWAIIPENRFWNTVWRSSPLYASVQKKMPWVLHVPYGTRVN